MILLLKILQGFFSLVFRLPARVALSIMYSSAWLLQAIAKMTPLKKSVINNIKLLLPQSPAKQIASKLIKNVSYSAFELLCFPFFKKEHSSPVFAFEGKDHLDQALAEKKGVILLTIHAGNYEAAGSLLPTHDYKVTGILRATNDPIFELVNQSRQAGGAKLVNILQGNMYQESLKALANNEIIYLMADTGALESRHEYLRFLGKSMPVATGWVTLAQRSGAPVVPFLVKRTGRKNIVQIHQPIKVNKENRQESMQAVAAVFEEFIKQNPDHWWMFLNEYETKRMVSSKPLTY